MNIGKVIRNSAAIAIVSASTLLYTGCGGVSEAQMQELETLRNDVSTLESQSNSLKEERTKLENDIKEKNAKLQQCEKDKQETQANLDKLPK